MRKHKKSYKYHHKPGDGHQHQREKKGDLREGVIAHHGRFAFLLANAEGEEDVFLRGRGLDLALDGDIVAARVHREFDGRWSGEIVRVISHARTSLVGLLKKSSRGWAVFPEKGYAPPAQALGFAHTITPKEGDLVVLAVSRWPTLSEQAAGTVTEVLGTPDDVHARLTAVLRAKGIVEAFPKEVLKESNGLPEKVEPRLWHGREELFHLPIVTIDGADAKDFDDAVSLETIDSTLVRLGVHIADVAHYVKPSSALDAEAYNRGTSVYLPDRVVPMLPPSLSNNLCSLLPGEERLTMSVFMDIDREGRVKRRRMANTVIRSSRRFTYEEVEALLGDRDIPHVTVSVGKAVLRMGTLAEVLTRRRFKRGALDFNLPEYKVETDEQGKPVRVSLRPRLQSHRLIEEFMLLANEAIATELMAAHRPFLHRRHDDPDPSKIKVLAKTLGEMGFSAGHLVGGDPHKALQDILRQAEGHPLADIVISLLVRSMQQAVYSPVSEGHFGIAARAYAHFTSPIRRYPDLMAHRALKALLSGEIENHSERSLLEAGKHCSERERSAADAEHTAVDIMRAELFKNMIGHVLDGTVTTVIETGSFVSCAGTGAEGLVRVTHLKPGDKVKVIVDSVDTINGKIDLSLAEQLPQIPPQWRVRSRTHGQSRGYHKK